MQLSTLSYVAAVDPYGDDIFNEPDGDPDTLANLGPLAPLAGVWEGRVGVDAHAVEEGIERDQFIEHIELHPIDRQTNGPQLLYGLRYHTHIHKPGEVETFHDQVGYWLWEPATETVTMTLALPRAQGAMASGRASADARSFEVRAALGDEHHGILSGPFLADAFRTTAFRMTVTVHDDGTWSYDQETLFDVKGHTKDFAHTDRNTLHRVGDPMLNPLAIEAGL